jgi:hypothetical protein
MKKPVRIYKAQFGAQQAMQQQQQVQQPQQPQVDENMLYNAAADMINQGAAPEEVLSKFIEGGVPQEMANKIISTVVAYLNDEEAYDNAVKSDDTEAQEELGAQRQAEEAEAEQQLAYQQQMQSMYSQDADPGYDEEDQVMQQNLMRFGGNQVPKKTFLKKAMGLLKKDYGGEEEVDAQETNVADSTDTGERAERLSNFLGTVQGTANQAKMQEDAEAMYSQYQQSFGQPMDPYGQEEEDMGNSMARRGRQMGPGRQERQVMRGVDKVLRSMPMGMSMPGQGFMPPNVNVFNMPMMAGAGMPNMQQMPDTGYFSGGPRLANIDVRKTGIFGRPKEYSITWANDAYSNPAIRQDVIRQEQHNEENQVKDKITDDKATTTNTATDKNAEVKVEEKKDPKVTTGATTRAQTPGRSSSTTFESSGTYVDEDVNEPIDPQEEPWAAALRERSEGLYSRLGYDPSAATAAPANTAARSNYVSSNTAKVDMNAAGAITYYDPNKPGYMYVSDGINWYYDAPGGDMTLQPVKDPKRVSYLNENLEGANMYTLPSKKGYYYRLRPDGAYAKYSGNSDSYSPSAKPVQVIKPGDPNYDYLNKNKQYSHSYVGKQQFGGMTDQASGLTKFVNGGDDISIPVTGGKLTNDPYFRDGGLYKFQGEGDSAVDAGNTGDAAADPDITNQEMYDFLKTQGYNVGEYREGIDYSQLTSNKNSGNSQGQGFQQGDEIRQDGSVWRNGTQISDGRGTVMENRGQGSYYPDRGGPYAYGQGYYPPAMGYNNPYMGNYNMYNQATGAMYPPMFGNRFGPPGRVFERAGSWLQQSGLPFDPATGLPITGMLDQQPLSRLDVTKSGIFGPKEFAMYFGDQGNDYKGADFGEYKNPFTARAEAEAAAKAGQDSDNPKTDRQGRILSYAVGDDYEFNQNRDDRQQKRLDRQVDRGVQKYNRQNRQDMQVPESINQGVNAYQGFKNLSNESLTRAYGGEQLPQAQMMGEFNAGVSDIPAGYYKDNVTGLVKNNNGMTYSPYGGYGYNTDKIMNADWTNQYMAYGGMPEAQYGFSSGSANQYGFNYDPASMDSEEGQFNNWWGGLDKTRTDEILAQQEQELQGMNAYDVDLDAENASMDAFAEGTMANKQPYGVKGKIKNMFNVDFERGVNEFNKYAGLALSPFEKASDRLAAPNINELTGSERNYGNKWFQNKGRDPETNSGLSFINQKGAKLQKKKGGSTYKEGAVTYMSPKQVAEFIKQGGKIEFIK